MVKFPTQNKLQYQTGQIGAAYSGLTSGGVTGALNLPKDLSALNRRGYAMTTRKGVPLIYRAKVDFYFHDEDGNGPSVSPGTYQDLQATLKIDGCQNNWTMRNAAVKFHAAREKMFRDAGIKKKSRGAYAHTIRYNFSGASDTWIVPIDGSGDAFTGGTWDASTLGYNADTGFQLKLVGNGDDEEADAFAGSVLSIGHSYLVSRMNQLADTNPELDETPAKFSLLNNMLMDPFRRTVEVDDVREIADGEQDNPPYEVLDISDSGDVTHDITEPVELGRAIAGSGAAFGSCIVDIPFGIAAIKATYTATNSLTPASGEPKGLVNVTLLDIYEMQG